MLKLEQQVCSLELAKRLKELNCPQESLFWWHPVPEVLPNSGGRIIRKGYDLSYADTGRFYGSGAKISAFTVAELGEMLPPVVNGTVVHFGKVNNQSWYMQYRNPMAPKDVLPNDVTLCDAPTEADARAKMLIYLIENGLLDPKTLKV